MLLDDIADPTDWLPTPLAGLFAVESALRCEICKDFYTTPMITSCAHTFCSVCIRRALASDSKCPLCRAPDQELKLRSNWSMEQTVSAFSDAREALICFARGGGAEKKRSADEEDDASSQPAREPKRLRSSARIGSRVGATPASIASGMNVVDDSQDEDTEPEKEDGLVPCPICQVRMKEWQVFAHLESCSLTETAVSPTTRSRRNPTSSKSPTQQKPPPPPPSPAASGQMQYHRPSPSQQTAAPERLPSLSYTVLKEAALRRKLADLGIPSQGPRPLLERRHREWLTIWNANCDAARPRRRADLLRDLDRWERTQGGKAPAVTGRMAVTTVAIRDKAFDGAAWAARHADSFRDLAAAAVRGRDKARKAGDDGDDTTAGDENKAEEVGGVGCGEDT